ncbi:hypothetical protein TRV_02908 [Trichophyton verrucosum HKI 0517]|uniref:Conidiophore development protein hymA n=1 Tax=Trichophyton verrucosum (strain HKI 0517) TaxID=663202 RepID=D4D729_TRIVH|nr:uncharacterized protein TRV_02908 [Trichophyton verrucosum HKI 0517]EFE42303.1 hypothetical protein TRV_02908 [Trichophyton verrucosum HKI 0517]
MAFLFNRSRQRQPAEVARTTKDLLVKLRDVPGDAKVNPSKVDTLPDQVQQLVHASLQEDLLYELARSIPNLPFEARKDTQTIFSHILRFRPDTSAASSTIPNSAGGGGAASVSSTSGDPPVISYVVHKRPEILTQLCRGYENNKSAMPCGSILREALKYEVVAGIILYDESGEGERAIRLNEIQPGKKQSGEGLFWSFLGWINQSSFEDILTRHKALVAGYLSANFDLFFSRYNNILVLSDSYVTKRQSIKLLGELLLDRANYNVMTAYVDSGDHLKLCMNLLRDDRKMVQYEGFHIFKVFVANPNKSVAVQRILINNRERLLKFLPKFLEDRTDDDQFTDEKSFLVRQIENLPSQAQAQ